MVSGPWIGDTEPGRLHARLARLFHLLTDAQQPLPVWQDTRAQHVVPISDAANIGQEIGTTGT
eukprot:12019502-Karenia_brevis.AAC.1